ncbi:ABC transporter permease subunit [Actinomadura rugatobispora]|uniref:ATP-binding cassette domain-containing protein n=1 Tax=Actinomadura rugatobispora TaxID=1994 RepID=A0ABW1A5H4_9ACTN|nr:branched-chain amino acid ABC transporter permease/ATP-binding protein [Actinomadura rugatobispora]
MNEFLPFIVAGLATGAVYGLAGLGVVLTYKTSGIFNFGYGAVAALSAFLFHFLRADLGIPWPIAAAVCLGVLAPAMGLLLELLARSLAGANETIKVVTTVGMILIVAALGALWHPDNPPTFAPFLPQSTVRLLGVNVTWEQIVLFAFSLAASAVLFWFFRSVRFGIVMRGVVDDPDLVSMSGDDPVRVRRWAWILGTMFSVVAGLLLASAQPLDGVTLSTVVFAAFGAAAVGRFSSLPLTFAGGLLIGVAVAMVDKYAATVDWVGGMAPSLPFLILFVVLIVTPRGKLVQRRLVAQAQAYRPYHAPARVRLAAGAVAVGLLALVPAVQGAQIAVWSAALVHIILFLSLGLLIRQSGQISLCHMAFAAVGAAAFAHFAAVEGMPWAAALLLAALVAVPVGALIAIPAVRVSGVFLALATLGFGILAQQVFYTRGFMFGDSTMGIPAPRPTFTIGSLDFSTDEGFYYLLLVAALLVVVLVVAIGHGRLGRLLEAMADSPLALETHGATSSVLKVIVFCLSAALASLAGAFTGMLYQFGIGTYFEWFNSILIVAVVLLVTVGSPWYAVIAAIAYSVIPGYLHGGATTNSVLQLLFGLGAVTAVYATRAAGTPEPVRNFLDRLGGRRPAPATTGEARPAPRAPVTVRREEPAGKGLEVRDLTVRFGGVTAVDNVSLTAPPGAITGLVGPNGAGKTTTFNACSGLNSPTSGRILLHGADVTRASPARRARRGLGRTFQRTELFGSLTVRQNIAMGREAALAGGNPLAQLAGSRHAARLVADAAEEAMALTGTDRIADVQAGLLPIGQRRLVELARALAGPFDLLLLDEPSSGLDAYETEEFGRVLKTVVRERGTGILLVEHDMTLVREVCDRVHVLDFGSLIFEGTPEEMHASERVRAAYLGDAVALAGE